jgi:hypothetical protein
MPRSGFTRTLSGTSWQIKTPLFVHRIIGLRVPVALWVVISFHQLAQATRTYGIDRRCIVRYSKACNSKGLFLDFSQLYARQSNLDFLLSRIV